MVLMSWTCKQCGSCCKILGSHRPLKEEDRLLLQIFDRGDGVCEHLTEDNLCNIYETRPEICKVDINDTNLEKACEDVRSLILKGDT